MCCCSSCRLLEFPRVMLDRTSPLCWPISMASRGSGSVVLLKDAESAYVFSGNARTRTHTRTHTNIFINVHIWIQRGVIIWKKNCGCSLFNFFPFGRSWTNYCWYCLMFNDNQIRNTEGNITREGVMLTHQPFWNWELLLDYWLLGRASDLTLCQFQVIHTITNNDYLYKRLNEHLFPPKLILIRLPVGSGKRGRFWSLISEVKADDCKCLVWIHHTKESVCFHEGLENSRKMYFWRAEIKALRPF